VAVFNPMPAFAVSIRLPASFTEEFLAIIPKHRDFINNLLSEHVIEAYAISADRGRGWVIINGDDEATVRTIVEQFPLHPYFQKVEIDELLIFDSASFRFPHISLN
jgi:hypothetical protein